MAMMRPCHCVTGPPAGGVCTACGAVGPPLPSIERIPHTDEQFSLNPGIERLMREAIKEIIRDELKQLIADEIRTQKTEG